MKYNLTKYSQTISNTSVGDISLTTDEVINILNTTVAQVPVPASGTTSGTLVLDCDLGARVHVEDVRYFFDSSASSSGIAPYIKFYYKNESFDIYVSLNTYFNENYYYTIVSGTEAPRYIRVEHTVVSGSEGSVNSLQVLNDDTYVDFGEDGTKTSHNVSLSLENAIVEINEMFVYNSGPVTANAKIVLEPQDTAADDILSISTTSEGPWYGVYRDEDKITGAGLWETGIMDNLQETSDILRLVVSGTVGTYTNRIIQLEDNQRLNSIVISRQYPTLASGSGKSIIATDDIDTLENIEVRSSNYEPMPRETYIEMTGSYGASTKYTQHRWIADSTVSEVSDDWGTWGRTGNYFEYWYDSIREDEYIVDKSFYTAGNTDINFVIRRKNGTGYTINTPSLNYDTDRYWNTYKLSPNSAGGFWVYFFSAYSDINTGIYYLRYYDASAGLIYDRQATAAQGTFLYDMDVVYGSSGDLWYTDRDLSTVFKINTAGTILASYLATEDIRGIFALNDGGCWFIQQQALIRLDSSGQVTDEIELSTSTVSYIYSDMEDGFWLHDGLIIRHLFSDGTEDFNIELPDLYWITVIHSGVVTKEHDGSITNKPYASYISKVHKRIISTWDYPVLEGGYKGTFDSNRYGVRSHTYDDLVDDHASHFPIAIDNQWNTYSDWVPVSLRDYNFTNEQYHQIRFTLRADNSNNSPEVYGLWTQRAIEISNIYPGNYGRFYLKSDVAGLNPQDVGSYTSKVRAYWLLDAE